MCRTRSTSMPSRYTYFLVLLKNPGRKREGGKEEGRKTPEATGAHRIPRQSMRTCGNNAVGFPAIGVREGSDFIVIG